MKNKIIYLCAQENSIKKPGGDYYLIKEYSKILTELNYEVKIIYGIIDKVDKVKPVLIIIFNLDLLFDTYQNANFAVRSNIPYMIYTLYHPKVGVQRYLKTSTIGIKFFLALSVNFHPIRYEVLKSIFKHKKLAYIVFIFRINTMYTFIEKTVNKILVSNEQELIVLKDELNYSINKFHILPHILNIPYIKTNEKDSKLIICAGRIEARKNQLKVFDLINSFKDYKFVFIGQSNPNEVKYFNTFLKKVDQYKNVEYINRLNLDEFNHYISKAYMLISMSWFEVVSLIELTAYNYNCKMVVSNYSYLNEYIEIEEKDILFLNPEINKDDFIHYVAKLLHNQSIPKRNSIDACKENSITQNLISMKI